MLRALSSHQIGVVLSPGHSVISGLSLLLVFALLVGFSLCFLSFLPACRCTYIL